jgi:hypothetical protein
MGTPIRHADSAIRLGRDEIDEETRKRKTAGHTVVLFAKVIREDLAHLECVGF